MTTPDRTEELIRAMLERRSAEPVPPWLADRTMHAVTVAHQVRRGWRGHLLLPQGAGPRVALVAALVATLLMLTGGALVAAGLIDLPGVPEASAPAGIVVPGQSPSATTQAVETPAPPESTPRPSLEPPPTARPVPDALAADTLAVVTRGGDGLRVRSAPGVGADSEKFEPLLATGTRMFIAGGPVPADGYDWYQVLVDPEQENLFGWVAAASEQGVAWVEPVEPECVDGLDEATIIGMNRLDYLVCYGGAKVQVFANRIEASQGDDTPCLSIGLDVCTVEPGWMNLPIWLGLDVGEGETSGLRAVASPDVHRRAAAVPPWTPVVLTLTMDDPAARDCRYLDANGADLVSPDRAAMACRMEFVVTDLAWDEPEPTPSDLRTDGMASVNADSLDVWSAPPDDPDARLLYSVPRDTLLYVDAGPRESDGGTWYGVLPEDPAVGRYGWVYAGDPEDPTLAPVPLDCPSPEGYAAFNQLTTVRRLVCSDGEPVTVDVVIRAAPEPQPTSAFACSALPYFTGRPPCQATPEWLASPTGVDVDGPSFPSFPAVDPGSMSQSELPATPTAMSVIGRYEHPASADCRVTNPTTGEELMVPAEAAIYCRARFVITGTVPND